MKVNPTLLKGLAEILRILAAVVAGLAGASLA